MTDIHVLSRLAKLETKAQAQALQMDILSEAIDGIERTLRVIMEKVFEGDVSEKTQAELNKWLADHDTDDTGRLN